MENAFPLVKR